MKLQTKVTKPVRNRAAVAGRKLSKLQPEIVLTSPADSPAGPVTSNLDSEYIRA